MESGHDGLCLSTMRSCQPVRGREGEGGSHSAKSVLTPLSLYDSYFGVTNNISESMSCVTKVMLQ